MKLKMVSGKSWSLPPVGQRPMSHIQGGILKK